MDYLQDHLTMKLKTPLSTPMLLRRLRGEEGISSPFRFQLEMCALASDIELKALLGQSIGVSIGLPDGSNRYIHGRVLRFQHGGNNHDGMNFYHAEVVPWFWLLDLNADCRIFQHLTTQQIVTQIFDESGFHDYEFRGLIAGQAKREYCVQYRETSFNFVSRLLEEEGIYYYFEFHEDRHVMVIADSPIQHAPYPNFESTHVSNFNDPRNRNDVILELFASEELQTSRVTLNEFNFTMPRSPLLTEASTGTAHEIYDYPGLYTNRDFGDTVVVTRLGECLSATTRLSGSSNCRHFTAGFRLLLEDYKRAGVDSDQVLHTVVHEAHQPISLSVSGQADESFHYHNSFTTFPHNIAFRPPRVTRKPTVTGSQTAIVVGRAGEEIWTDQYGRVQVQFHWDRLGRRDERSSCFIRVAQLWAGKQWGAMYIPRIGHEVVVDFLEGDPDRPIIVGRVYNGDNMPPYPLPAEQTKSTIKSDSSKGGGGFNEFRFEDRKGSEEIFLHAQKDLNEVILNDMSTAVGVDQSVSVGHDRTKHVVHDETVRVGNDRVSTVGRDETRSVGNDRSTTIGNNETLAIGAGEIRTVGADRSTRIGRNDTLEVGSNQIVAISSHQTHSIGGGRSAQIASEDSLSVGGGQHVNVNGAHTLTVSLASAETVGLVKALTVGGAYQTSVAGIMNTTVGLSSALEVVGNHSESAREITIKGKDKLTLTCGRSSIVIEPASITIESPLVKINC